MSPTATPEIEPATGVSSGHGLDGIAGIVDSRCDGFAMRGTAKPSETQGKFHAI